MRRIAGISLTLAIIALALAAPVRAQPSLADFIGQKLKALGLASPASKRHRRTVHPSMRHRPRVPLPRPRPFLPGRPPGAMTAAKPVAPVVADAAGRVLVKPEALAKERDHFRAVYLQPKEIGHWDVETVRKARRNCELVLATLNVDASPIDPIGGPQGCGIAAPVLVRSLGIAELKPAAKLNCRFTAALYEWMRSVVQPAARRIFGQPVVAIRQLSHYSCRRRGGVSKGPVRISEHSFGNAIDIGGFVLASGDRISLLKDWGEFSALFNKKAAFLQNVGEGACKYFSTVLSPRYNKAHANHFHFDLGRGGRYKICK